LDRRSLQDLCDEYTPRLAVFFARNAVASHEVADLVQECFLVLCRRHEAVLGGKAGPFLYGIARNLLMAHRRKSHDAAARMAQLAQDAAHSHAASSADTPHNLAAQQEQTGKLLTAVERLPDHQKEVIRLVHFQGLSRAEAAREMGVTRQTLHVHEQRALETLRMAVQSSAVGS